MQEVAATLDGGKEEEEKEEEKESRRKVNPSTPMKSVYAEIPDRHYQIIAHPAQEELALRLVKHDPKRFTYHPTNWSKFKDGTDNIEVGGFNPVNYIRGAHVLFLASFHNNDVTLSQFHVLNMLCESFVETMCVILPYWPFGTTPIDLPRDPVLSKTPQQLTSPHNFKLGTMERVVREGQVATASTLARLFSNLPRVGKPIRVMVYDLHTLQNRFYLSGNALASLHTAIPLLINELRSPESKISCIAFPDEGACKRFSTLFSTEFPDWPVVTCGKIRDGDRRVVTIQDGDPKDRHVIIVDDLVQVLDLTNIIIADLG
ncbi:hypothetical protein GUITHDRAFT_161462 [Guillardia theta CCMP2712]|uniref:Phosphoribosyltransferase domain-containing protein n=1 Tax=Guillardia theta (strain CCMP2712) TaxID=905079 RepID=L1JTM2_GUITC|nr:hypothetical protein GUITHDRAFT_161462 [Guillardia theta CCMP2712]EKX51906.1 hypothetical protein GUITHDRAFT_161462 [Guillardia theta CCMP2712]|eukprot:XP_005838886.1 hypothetical protein GUITHDRAFT_161462 [Guillardia theta CCMP2712]